MLIFLKKGIWNVNKCGKEHKNAWDLLQLLQNRVMFLYLDCFSEDRHCYDLHNLEHAGL